MDSKEVGERREDVRKKLTEIHDSLVEKKKQVQPEERKQLADQVRTLQTKLQKLNEEFEESLRQRRYTNEELAEELKSCEKYDRMCNTSLRLLQGGTANSNGQQEVRVEW